MTVRRRRQTCSELGRMLCLCYSLEREGKSGAFAETALCIDLSAVRLDEPPGYRQPEARPRIFSYCRRTPRPLAPKGALEDTRKIFGCDPLPGVGDLYPHRVLLWFCPEEHGTVGRRMAQGVGDQVVKHALELGRASEYGVHF